MSGDCTSEECRTRYDAMFEACSESGCQINLLERDNAALKAEVDHLRRGIEAYREYINTQNPYPMMRWEREEAKRDER